MSNVVLIKRSRKILAGALNLACFEHPSRLPIRGKEVGPQRGRFLHPLNRFVEVSVICQQGGFDEIDIAELTADRMYRWIFRVGLDDVHECLKAEAYAAAGGREALDRGQGIGEIGRAHV